MIRHPEIVVPREDWRTLSADFVVGGICHLLFERHGAAETSRFRTSRTVCESATR